MQETTALLSSFQHSLQEILSYWEDHTIDEIHGGFVGRIDGKDEIDRGAKKGGVLNARILWSFSAAWQYRRDPRCMEMADRAFDELVEKFVDPEYGGIYWSVTAEGAPMETRKQIYALAFAIYGLSEYYRACGNLQALELAKELYQDIERHSYDQVNGGYLEALTREWAPIEDLRLSVKDANEKKTMNTHLHILEAYTNLYRVWKDEVLREKIRGLLDLFIRHIVDPVSGHLRLFFGEDWELRSDIVSYGHDIEASWLLLEAAEVTGDEILLDRIKGLSILIARAAAEGIGSDGSMYYEKEGTHLVAERHWWVQAEAAVGFLNAWQLTREEGFYAKFTGVWKYTLDQIVDHQKGEWYWGRRQDGAIMEGEDKAGFWKCPYHNSRACLEIIRRLALVVLFFLSGAAVMYGQSAGSESLQFYQHIRQVYLDSSAHLYRETNHAPANEHKWSYLWPLCAFVQAGNEMEVLEPGKTFVPDIMASIDRYYSVKKGVGGYDSYVVSDGGGDRFFDDNQWIGLAYMDAYRRTRTSMYLRKSEEIYRFMMTGYDTVTGGGLYWKEGDPGSKNTCSNGPAVLLALSLYQATKKQSYLDTALMVFHWTHDHLQRADGIYFDAIRTASGKIDSAVYTYNTGTMLQANVVLYTITRKKDYLKEAQRLADASLKTFYRDGRFPDGPWFNAVLLRGYQALYEVDHNELYLRAMGQDADRIWKNRDAGGLIGKGEARKMLDQAGYLEIMARLAFLHKRLRN